MNGQEYFTQPDGQGIVFPREVGVGLADPKVPRPGVVTRTQTPVTRSYRTPLRKIGKPGVLGDIKTWWSKLPTWQKGAVIGVPVVVGIVIAASQKGEGKGSSVGKI